MLQPVALPTRVVFCSLCGEPSDHPDGICTPCIRAVTQMRGAVESRGGSLVIVGNRLVVRTRVQLRDPEERMRETADIGAALIAQRLIASR